VTWITIPEDRNRSYLAWYKPDGTVYYTATGPRPQSAWEANQIERTRRMLADEANAAQRRTGKR
jgi:hypothetical protein